MILLWLLRFPPPSDTTPAAFYPLSAPVPFAALMGYAALLTCTLYETTDDLIETHGPLRRPK